MKKILCLLAFVAAMFGVGMGFSAPAGKQPSVTIESPYYGESVVIPINGTMTFEGYCAPNNALITCTAWYWSPAADDWARAPNQDWSVYAVDGYYTKTTNAYIAGNEYYVEITSHQGLATATESVMFYAVIPPNGGGF